MCVMCSPYTQAVWDETDVATPFPPLRKLVLFIDDGYQIDEARLADMQQCVTSAEVGVMCDAVGACVRYDAGT